MSVLTGSPWLVALAALIALVWALRKSRGSKRDWFFPFATIVLVLFG